MGTNSIPPSHPHSFAVVQIMIAQRILEIVHVAVAVRVAEGGGRAGRNSTVSGDLWVLAVIPVPHEPAGVSKLTSAIQSFAARATAASPGFMRDKA